MNDVNTAGTVVVAGSGVVGLTTAYYLASRGWETNIRHVQQRSPSSLAACALFLPYFGTAEGAKTASWFRSSWRYFEAISGRRDSGVSPIRMIEMFRNDDSPPALLESLTSVHWYRRSDLPRDFSSVWDFTTWLIDIPIYIGYLRRLCVDAGVVFSEQLCGPDTVNEPGIAAVVDCCGHWSTQEFGVTAVRPVRGQTIILPRSRLSFALGGDEFILAPRGDGTLFGSLWKEDDSSSDVQVSDTETLLAELGLWCQAPLLSHVNIRMGRDEITGAFAGARPYRKDGHLVTVEAPEDSKGPLIHNTGHGGSGVSLAWGTATEVEILLTKALEKPW